MRKIELIEMFGGGGSISIGQANTNFWNNDDGGEHTDLGIDFQGNTESAIDGVNIARKGKGKSKIKGANVANAAFSAVDMGLDLFDNGEHTGGRRSVGGQALGGASQGASLGLSVGGPAGALIGGILGAGYGLIKGASDKRKALDEIRNTSDRQFNYYNDNTLQANINPNGERYEDGGATGGNPMSKTAGKLINIEKGELMIDPMNMTVIQKFTNPNRFSSHKPSQLDEPMGNFITVPDDVVIIPKRLAGRFEKGDKLARKSIVMNILSDQAMDPNHNKPNKFASGGYTGYNSKRKLKLPFDTEIDGEPIGPENIQVGTNSMGRSFMTKTKVKAPGFIVDDLPSGESNTDITGNETSYDRTAPDVNTSNASKGKGRKSGSMFARTLLQNAPIIQQLIDGTDGDPYLRSNPNVQMNTAISYAHQLPEDISIASQLAANDRSFMLASKAIDNNDTPSVRAEKAQLLAEKFAGDNTAYMGREGMRAQLKSTKLQTLLGLSKEQGADWQQDERYLSNELRMDAANRDNIRGAAIANLSENLMKGQNDNERLKAINTITHSIDIDPFAKNMIKEDPGFLPFMYDYVLGGKGDYIDAKNEFLSGRRDKDKTTNYDKTVTNPKGGQTTTKGVKIEKTR